MAGPMFSKDLSKQFADQVVSLLSREDLAKFKELFEYANSMNGMMMSKDDSYRFAWKYFGRT